MCLMFQHFRGRIHILPVLFSPPVARTANKEISHIDVPVKYKDSNGKTVVLMESWPILDPHLTLDYIVGSGKLDVPESERSHFWRSSKLFGEAWAQNVASESIYPIGLYGDSAKVTTKFGSENILAMFLSIPLWKPSSVRFSRFLLFAIPEERMTSKTLNYFLRRITWSCNHAWFGRFPETDHRGQVLGGNAGKLAGKPLSGRFQVVEHRGDWAWAKKVWRFRDCHWRSQHVCHICDAQAHGEDPQKLFWAEPANHVDFSTIGFLAHRCPHRDVCDLVLIHGQVGR